MQTSSLTSLVSLLILILIAVANSSVTVKKTSDELPHPSAMELELVLPDSNKKLLVPLTRITAFENIPMTLLENGHSRRFSSRQVRHPSHSHYRDLDSGSVISVRSVNGSRFLSGHVMHKGISYSLEPIGESEHRIVKSERSSSEASLKRVISKKLRTLVSRRKRQASKKYLVELNLLLDHTVWATIKEISRGDDSKTLSELYFYYTHILNGIDTVFHNIPSLSIGIRCIGFTIAKSPKDSVWLPPKTLDGGDILAALSGFTLDTTADHIMAFTRKDITANGSEATGLSYPSGACKESYRVSVIEDNGPHSWSTAAHELGHNLGAEHDSEGNNCLESEKFVLAPAASFYSLFDVANSYRFSTCSVDYIRKYIDSLGESNCLLKTEGTVLPYLTSPQRMGARIGLGQVCRLTLPDRSKDFFLTEEAKQNPASICASISCKSHAMGKIETIPEIRAPVGTPCGNHKSCNWNGECKTDLSAPAANDACFWGDTWRPLICAHHKRAILTRQMACTPVVKLNCCKTLAGLILCDAV